MMVDSASREDAVLVAVVCVLAAPGSALFNALLLSICGSQRLSLLYQTDVEPRVTINSLS